MRKKVVVCHLIDEEVREIQPWIVAPPLPTGYDKPEVRDKEVQTEFVLEPKTDGECNTDIVEREVDNFILKT